MVPFGEKTKVGQVTVSVAAAVVAVPQEFVNTARYWLPFCEICVVKVRLVFVAPMMSVNGPPPVEICHCTVGAGVPVAPAVKVTGLPAWMDWLIGSRFTAGAV